MPSGYFIVYERKTVPVRVSWRQIIHTLARDIGAKFTACVRSFGGSQTNACEANLVSICRLSGSWGDTYITLTRGRNLA